MTNTTDTATPPTSTPWGSPQGGWKKHAPGIFECSTASHGGFWLSPDRLAAMPSPSPWPNWNGNGPWFEEDEDALLVFHAFPDLFPAEYQGYVTRAIEGKAARAAARAA